MNTRVLVGSHANESLSFKVYDKLQAAAPIDDVSTRIAHPEAAARGVRQLGKSQIMACYPGDIDGDPEEQAAAATMKWLGGSVGREDTLVLDLHNTTYPGLEYATVGTRALKAAVCAAYELGHTKIVARPGPFYAAVPNAVVLEESVTSEEEEWAKVEKLYKGIGKLATCSAEDLSGRYTEIADELTFLQKFELFTLKNPPRQPKAIVVKDPVLQRLEAMPDKVAFTELDTAVKSDLGFSETAPLYYGSWGHHNMSNILPDTAQANGEPRRMCFGELYMQIPPPKEGGNWLNFPTV